MTAVILVVEDQPAMQRNIQIGLTMSGYEVVVAADGIEALDLLAGQPVDLILADIAMPRMNGYQLYEKVRQDPRWVRIPFVFISARGLDSDVRYGKALGADDYLVSPSSSKICWRSWLAGCGARANWRRPMLRGQVRWWPQSGWPQSGWPQNPRPPAGNTWRPAPCASASSNTACGKTTSWWNCR